MFGIGLPEFILIMALALIVVGPDKLPDLARSVAKGILELKKTANSLKENLTADGNPLDDIKPELEEAARSIKDQVLDVNSQTWKDHDSVNPPAPSESTEATSPVIDVAAEKPAEPSVQGEETASMKDEGKGDAPSSTESSRKSNVSEQQS